jgi:hypothetical protein
VTEAPCIFTVVSYQWLVLGFIVSCFVSGFTYDNQRTFTCHPVQPYLGKNTCFLLTVCSLPFVLPCCLSDLCANTFSSFNGLMLTRVTYCDLSSYLSYHHSRRLAVQTLRRIVVCTYICNVLFRWYGWWCIGVVQLLGYVMKLACGLCCNLLRKSCRHLIFNPCAMPCN